MSTILNDNFNNLSKWHVVGDGTQGSIDIVSHACRMTRAGNGWGVFGMWLKNPRRFKHNDEVAFEFFRGETGFNGFFQLKDVQSLTQSDGALKAGVVFAPTEGSVRAYLTDDCENLNGNSILIPASNHYIIKLKNENGKLRYFIKAAADTDFQDLGLTNVGGYDNKLIYPTYSLHSNGGVLTLDNFKWVRDGAESLEVTAIKRYLINGTYVEIEDLD